MSDEHILKLNNIGTVSIETERCLLRRINNTDCESMYNNWARLEECSRYFPFSAATDIESYKRRVEAWIANYTDKLYFQWIVALKSTNEPIGIMNLGNIEENLLMADINYILSPKYHRMGIMTEAVTAILDFAFTQAGFHRIQAEVFDGNTASAALLDKIGFRLEGIARQKYIKNGKFIDTAQYAILDNEFNR